MTKKNKPHIVSLTQDEADAFKNRVVNSSLAEQDKKIVLALLSFNFWLQTQMMRAKLTILRLKKIFGLPTEKNFKTKSTPDDPVAVDPVPPSSTAIATNDSNTIAVDSAPPKQKRKPRFDPAQNHGRHAASDYTGCLRVSVLHKSLKPGDGCPSCVDASLHGKLYALLPKEVVKLQGNPLITGTCYECEKLRCTPCGNQYEAKLPDDIANRPKYDDTCRSSIAIARYYAGLPLKRLEGLQASQGVPLADATQWDQIKKLYPFVSPVYEAMERTASQGQLVHYDDTGNRILEAKNNTKAVHTTAFISTLDGKEALRVWLNNQLLYHLVEDNSGLGQATRYMLKHWNALTQFLRVAGAPIDNSLCEQAIKVAIRHRRNSLFYKTFKGAEIGDCLMSVIHTAAKNNINIFDYLNTLQRYQNAVRGNPDSWLPWRYQATLDKMTIAPELRLVS